MVPLYTGTTKGNNSVGNLRTHTSLDQKSNAFLSSSKFVLVAGYTSPGSASDLPVCLLLGSTSDLFRRYASFGSLCPRTSHPLESASEIAPAHSTLGENRSSFTAHASLVVVFCLHDCSAKKISRLSFRFASKTDSKCMLPKMPSLFSPCVCVPHSMCHKLARILTISLNIL